MKSLVIFDCDGVLVDSEMISNRVLAETLTEYGLPTTTEESIRTSMGRAMEVLPALLERWQGELHTSVAPSALEESR